MTGRLQATAAVAGAIAAISSLFATSAQSADFGGDCCTSLEERIAELEVTTARKGNRKVSLKVYGQVNTGVLFWDNGDEGNAYVVDNDTSSTRFGFLGKARINSEWSAGYRLELEFQSGASNNLTENNDEATVAGNIRQAYWFLKNKRLGRISVGQQDTANSGAAEVDLSGTNVIALSGHNAFIADIAVGNSNSVNWDTYVFGNSEFNRRNVVKYKSPTLAGLSLSASYGEDDLADIGLRYAGKAGGFKVAGAISYGETTDFGNVPRKDAVTLGSASIKHLATGLFLTGGVSYRERTTQQTLAAALERSQTLWHLRGGVIRRWTSLGNTSIYGEYANFNGDAAYGRGDDSADVYGGGFVQKIDAAAMELYIGYRHYSVSTDDLADSNNADTVMTGARVKF